MTRFTTLFTMFFMMCTVSFAQNDDACQAKAPSEVAVGKQFRYTVTTEEKGEIISSDFGKFELISGPSIGSSTSISITNGEMNQTTTYTYTYYLIGHKEGEFTIPGVSLSVDGRVLKSNFVTVKVVKAPKIAQEEQNVPGDDWFHMDFQMPEWPFGFQREEPKSKGKVKVDDKIGKDDILLKASTTQLEANQGEGVVVTHKLYISQEFGGYDITNAYFDDTENFWIEPLDLSNRAQASEETINGKTYNVYVIKQTVAYPTKTGKLTIPKLNLGLRVRVPAQVEDPIWGIFSSMQRKNVNVASNELTIKVKALPGANSTEKTEVVGNFTISSNINKTETHVNEPVTLTVTVSGTGNLHHIASEDLGIDFPADCDITYPRVTSHISARNDMPTGTKTFRYTIIPRSEGTFLIPGATFTYYNYETGTYKTLSSQDFQIEVSPAKNNVPSDSDDNEKKPKSNVRTYKI